MKFLSGFESTHIFGSGKDVLQLTKHTEFYEEDLQLAARCNLDLMRYSVPWHTIEREPGIYDWTWLDRAMNCLRELQIQPILDPLHHTSFPEWLTEGFADARFVSSYVRFVAALGKRYEWAKHYTIINEPFVTAFFCGHEGIWHPFRRGGENFVCMILNMGEAICRCTRALEKAVSGVQFIHVDTCEQHRAADAESIAETNFRNELRFLVHDLVLGKINKQHRLYPYLTENGASTQQLEWFEQHPARIDVLGLDYYAHSELEWTGGGETRVYPNEQPVGFAQVAEDYVSRYNLPVMLSETNIRGTVYDRISWLKLMVEQCEILKANLELRQIPFLGFCWYPLIDSTDWCSLVREAKGIVDPQGIFCLDNDCTERNASELSDVFAALAAGKICSKDLPAYHFAAPLDETLKNYGQFTKDWEWREIS